MTATTEQTPPASRPGMRVWVRVVVWLGIVVAGLIVGFIAWAPAWVAEAVGKHADGWLGNMDLAVLIPGAVLITALVLATATVAAAAKRADGQGRARRRTWVAVWAAAMSMFLAVLWMFTGVLDRSGCVRSGIVGTWRVIHDGKVVGETTYRSDGTCVAVWPVGSEVVRPPRTGTYIVSADGRQLRETYPQPANHAPVVNEPWWTWHIEFSDQDHFKVWQGSFNRIQCWYLRKE